MITKMRGGKTLAPRKDQEGVEITKGRERELQRERERNDRERRRRERRKEACAEKREENLRKIRTSLLNTPSAKRGRGEAGEWTPGKSRRTPVGVSSTKNTVEKDTGSIWTGGRGILNRRGGSLPTIQRAIMPCEEKKEAVGAGVVLNNAEKSQTVDMMSLVLFEQVT